MEPDEPKATKTKKNLKPLIMIGLIILLVAVAAIGGYWWKSKSDKKQIEAKAKEVTQLRQDKTDLEKQLAEEKTKSKTSTPATTPTSGPSQTVLTNVKESITSGNTAALEGYMNPKVLVIIAASEGIGTRTAAEAVGDVTSYIKNATAPWDFALPAATLNAYGSGGYAQYFPSGALVGKAANKYVISFSFNNASKITTVFMAASSDLL